MKKSYKSSVAGNRHKQRMFNKHYSRANEGVSFGMGIFLLALGIFILVVLPCLAFI